MPSLVQGTCASATNWVIALNIQPMNSRCKIRRNERDCSEKSLTDCKHIFNSSCSLRFICELGAQVGFLFGTHCRIFIVNIWIFNLKAKAFWLKSLMNPIGLDSSCMRWEMQQSRQHHCEHMFDCTTNFLVFLVSLRSRMMDGMKNWQKWCWRASAR